MKGNLPLIGGRFCTVKQKHWVRTEQRLICVGKGDKFSETRIWKILIYRK